VYDDILLLYGDIIIKLHTIDLSVNDIVSTLS